MREFTICTWRCTQRISRISLRPRGPDVYYYRDSIHGQEAATVFANNLKWLYPIPDLVTIIPNTTLAELRRVTAPAVLLELAYHDNYFDVEWLKNNIDAIAYNLSVSVADFLGVGIRYSLISDLRHFAYLHWIMVYFILCIVNIIRDIMKSGGNIGELFYG